MQLLHQNDCFLSREEYLGLFKKFGSGPKSTGEPDLNDFEAIFISDHLHLLAYKTLSKQMNLHHNYLDSIGKK
jgi:hypothetical protein